MPNSESLTQSDYDALAELRYQIRLFLRFSERAARGAGLEPQHHQALLALKTARGLRGSRVADLSEWLQIQHNTAVELVGRLEEKGLVQRARSREDRREVHVILTGRGERVLRELSLHHVEELRHAAPALAGALRNIVRTATRNRKKAQTAGRS